jgi:small-conductance mechanosensitive channel
MDWITGAGLSRVLTTVGVVVAALLVHMAVWRLVLRLMKDRDLAADLRAYCRWPARVVVVLAALLLALQATRPPFEPHGTILHLLLLLLVAAVAWLAVGVVRVAEDALLRRYNMEVPDNLRARRARTQVQVLGRFFKVTIVLLAGVIMLLSFPEARAAGASLLASAGIVGVIVGIAARSTVGNLIAGLQIAFAEPIRLDDAVVVEGEWGNVEEITLTYVVVRIWDRRRLVLPCSYFVENPIENWTRYSADIVGSVLLYVDYATPVDDLRGEFERVLAASELWNGQTAVLQVVDATEKTMVLRALVSADSAQNTWDLRSEVRERLLAWLQREHAEALPRLRTELERGAGHGKDQGHQGDQAVLQEGPAGPGDDRGRGRRRGGHDQDEPKGVRA